MDVINNMQNLISISQGVFAWGHQINARFYFKAKSSLTLFSAAALKVMNADGCDP